MNLGNNYVGLTTSEGYQCVKIFPFGIELCMFEEYVEIAFVIGPIEFSLTLKKNNTLFR
tara:strand:+ start:457 stop:633 length:177 start_codon:yes stop_codon:yes gene_type:complete